MAQRRFIKIALTVVILLCTTWLCHATDLLDTKIFSQVLSKLAMEGLGVSDLQKDFDRLRFNEEAVNGSSVILSLTATIANKFKERFNVVRKLKQAAEEAYGRSQSFSRQWECCKVKYSNNLEYDVRFRQRVDHAKACVKISGSALANRRYLDDMFVNEMKQILLDHPFVKWQYFGSEEGMLTLFPAFEDEAACPSFDPRFRPWYVETATPEPKDVVLVIDTSGSMVTALMNVAKEAAKTVLSTMNPRDRIGLVSFSTFASTPGKDGADDKTCFSERLADATPSNLKYLKGYLAGLKAQGVTNYANAFDAAFRLLKTSYQRHNNNRHMVILFLTDGVPSDDKTSIMQTIKDRNAELNNKVIIMTYGMMFNKKILLDIANQDGTSYGVSMSSGVTRGTFTSVSNKDNLRSAIATYYDFFSKNMKSNKPIISVPYIDAAGLGLLTTVALPCYHKNKFIGVVGTDISLESIESPISYFQKGQASYAFMVNSFGRAMIHPLLSAPSDAFEAPISMDIPTLEPEPEFGDVLASIVRGGDGQKTFVSKQFLARGGRVLDGVLVVELNSTYHWKSVPETNFAIGIVVPEGDTDVELAEQRKTSNETFLYHRLDLVKPDHPCVHLNRYASKGTVVKFSAEAFTSPFSYLGFNETASSVHAYQDYITRRGATNPGFKPGIRDTVLATGNVEDIWTRGSRVYENYLVWRFLGTENGVFRMRPGTSLPKSFDPRKRPWYHAAISNKGLVALTTPYKDAGGAGVVITAAHTIYYGKANHMHTTKDPVIAVMGADFPLSYFHRLLTDTYSKCKDSKHRCLVINKAGFVIMHNDFLSADIASESLEYVHITEKEKHMAEDLINKGYMVKKQCRNLNQLKLETFFEFQLPPEGVDMSDNGESCKRYQLSHVDGSNIFLGVILEDENCQSTSTCTCSSDDECSTKQGVTCQCPCSSQLNFYYCRHEFPSSRIPICPLPGAVDSTEQVVDPSTVGIPKCFDPRCQTKPDWDSCEGVVGCFWCVRDKNNVSLTTKYCADFNVCYGGTEKGDVLKDDKSSSKEDSLSPAEIAGIVCGSIIGIAIVVIMAAVITKRWKNRAVGHELHPPFNPEFVR